MPINYGAFPIASTSMSIARSLGPFGYGFLTARYIPADAKTCPCAVLASVHLASMVILLLYESCCVMPY